jgi:hypothetical protein
VARLCTPNVLSTSEALDRLDRFFWGGVISAPQPDLMLTVDELCGGIQQLSLRKGFESIGAWRKASGKLARP